MICLGQGGLRSLSASSSHYRKMLVYPLYHVLNVLSVSSIYDLNLVVAHVQITVAMVN